MMGKQAILGLMRRKSELILAQEKARAARPRCLFLVLLLFVVIVVFILVVIGIQGIVGGEEEVTQTHRDRVAAQLAGLAFGKRVEVEGVFAQALGQRFSPGLVFAERMLGILCDPLEGV